MLATGGCGKDAPKTDAAAQPLPALCSAPKPAQQTPFPYNRDTKRRSKLLDLGDSSGGIARFHDATVQDVAALLNERFLDPADRQNESPSAWRLFQFQCRHPGVLASGYAVEKDRSDYRVSLDAIDSTRLEPHLLAEAEVLCESADKPRADPQLHCRWD